MLKVALIKIVLSSVLLVNFSISAQEIKQIETMDELHNHICHQQQLKDGSWHLAHLYDCEKRELFIPYHLWTGAPWDGDKNANCEHKADSFFIVDDGSETVITGMHEWKNPKTDQLEKYWKRSRVDIEKIQHFTCHEKGIGRVYDSRRERYFEPGRCKFPAGYGWRLAIREYCRDTSIELLTIGVDQANNLTYIDFKWWYKWRGEYTPDYIYRYVPNYGMKSAWKQ